MPRSDTSLLSCGATCAAASGSRTTIVGSSSSCIGGFLVSIDPDGSHDYPSRAPRALASSGLSLILAVEITETGRAPANRSGLSVLGLSKIKYGHIGDPVHPG